jgi:hypothetical protein
MDDIQEDLQPDEPGIPFALLCDDCTRMFVRQKPVEENKDMAYVPLSPQLWRRLCMSDQDATAVLIDDCRFCAFATALARAHGLPKKETTALFKKSNKPYLIVDRYGSRSVGEEFEAYDITYQGGKTNYSLRAPVVLFDVAGKPSVDQCTETCLASNGMYIIFRPKSSGYASTRSPIYEYRFTSRLCLAFWMD